MGVGVGCMWPCTAVAPRNKVILLPRVAMLAADSSESGMGRLPPTALRLNALWSGPFRECATYGSSF